MERKVSSLNFFATIYGSKKIADLTVSFIKRTMMVHGEVPNFALRLLRDETKAEPIRPIRFVFRLKAEADERV